MNYVEKDNLRERRKLKQSYSVLIGKKNAMIKSMNQDKERWIRQKNIAYQKRNEAKDRYTTQLRKGMRS